MGIFSFFKKRNQEQYSSLHDNGPLRAVDVIEWGSSPSDAGIEVNETTALQSTAVMASVNVIAEDIAGIPWHTFSRDGKKRERAYTHPVYRLLHDAPNPHQTAFSWRYQAICDLLLKGNSYHLIERDANFTPVALWPVNPDRVTVRRLKGELVYEVLDGKRKKRYKAYEILHFIGKTFDGINGISVIQYNANAIGVTLAADKMAGKYYSRNPNMAGYLKHPAKLQDAAKANLKGSFRGVTTGIDNAYDTPILDQGLEYVPIQGIKAEEMQFLQTRKWGVEECCRLFRVSPIKIGHLERSTFNNIEELNTDHHVSTLSSWAKRLEQECKRKLFREDELATVYNEMDFDGFQRGNQASRYAAYATGKQWGWLSTNDIREKENMSWIEGGDDYLVPLNMMPVATQAGIEYAPTSFAKSQTPCKEKVDLAPIIDDTTNRLYRKEINAVKRAWKKHQEPEAFMEWAVDWYGNHLQLAKEMFAPIEKSTGAELNTPNEHIENSLRDLRVAVQSDNPAQEIDGVIARWEEFCEK